MSEREPGVPNLADAHARQMEEVRAAQEGRDPDFSAEHLGLYENPMNVELPVDDGGIKSEVTEEMLVGQFGNTVVVEEAVVAEEPEVVETPSVSELLAQAEAGQAGTTANSASEVEGDQNVTDSGTTTGN